MAKVEPFYTAHSAPPVVYIAAERASFCQTEHKRLYYEIILPRSLGSLLVVQNTGCVSIVKAWKPPCTIDKLLSLLFTTKPCISNLVGIWTLNHKHHSVHRTYKAGVVSSNCFFRFLIICHQNDSHFVMTVSFHNFWPGHCVGHSTGENRRFDRCILDWTNQCKSHLPLVAKPAFLQTATAASISGPIYETFFCSDSLKLGSFGYLWQTALALMGPI